MKYHIFLLFLATALTYSQYQPTVSQQLSAYAHIGYEKVESIIKWNCEQCKKHTLVDRQTFEVTSQHLFGYVGYSTKISGIIVAFRGTLKTSLKNILTDLNYLDVGYPNCKDCKVHKGFYKSFLAIKELVAIQLKKIIKLHPNSQIYFTGHSLGGALASLAAAEFSKSYKVGPVYTFGKPRVGNKKYADWFNSILTGYRIVHYYDVVPSIPPRKNPLKFWHHYTAIQRHELLVLNHKSYVNFEYYHQGKLVWYSSDMSKYQICEAEDAKCFNSVKSIFLSAKDHSSKLYALLSPVSQLIQNILGLKKKSPSHFVIGETLEAHD